MTKKNFWAGEYLDLFFTCNDPKLVGMDGIRIGM